MSRVLHMIREISEEGRAKATRALELARDRFDRVPTSLNSVAELDRFIGRYLQHQYQAAISVGGDLLPEVAVGRARQAIESRYRRQEETLLNALEDCRRGVRGGVRSLMDIIDQALRQELEGHYSESVIARYVPEDSWQDKVQIVRDLIEEFGPMLPQDITMRPAEQSAADYKSIIRRVVAALDDAARGFRRV